MSVKKEKMTLGRHGRPNARTGGSFFRRLSAVLAVLLAVGIAAVGLASAAEAWTVSASASVICSSNNTAVLEGTFLNQEGDSSGDMNVTMTFGSLSDGPRLVEHTGKDAQGNPTKSTGNFSIDTGQATVSDGTVTFKETWVNRSGSDSRTVNFAAKSCAPVSIPVTAGTPTFTEGSVICTPDYQVQYTKPSFTVPAQRAHIEFRLNGSDTAIQPGTYTSDFGSAVTLEAVADKGYTLENGPTWPFTFGQKPNAPECQQPTPTPTPTDCGCESPSPTPTPIPTVTPTPTPTDCGCESPTPTPTPTPSVTQVTAPAITYTQGSVICTPDNKVKIVNPTLTIPEWSDGVFLEELPMNSTGVIAPKTYESSAFFGTTHYYKAVLSDGSDKVLVGQADWTVTFNPLGKVPNCGPAPTLKPPTKTPVFHTGVGGPTDSIGSVTASSINWLALVVAVFGTIGVLYVMVLVGAFGVGVVSGARNGSRK